MHRSRLGWAGVRAGWGVGGWVWLWVRIGLPDEFGRLVIVCPLLFESAAVGRGVRAVLGRLGVSGGGSDRGGGGVGGWGGWVEVLTVGPGGVAAELAVRGLGTSGEITVLLVGVGGGLDPLMDHLAGWADEVVGLGGERFEPSVIGCEDWRDVLGASVEDAGEDDVLGVLLEHTPAALTVRVLGVDSVISSPAHKHELFVRTGAAVCDTESCAFAVACEARSKFAPTRWGVLRGVSDGAGDVLPACVVDWIDARGRTRVLKVLGDVVRRRVKIGELSALCSRSNRALSMVNDQLAAWLVQECVVRGVVGRDRAADVLASCAGGVSGLWGDAGGVGGDGGSDGGGGDGGGGGGGGE